MAGEMYPRWLKNAKRWAEDDDWSPDEYLKWVKRLAEAKAELDDTYRRVDRSLLKSAEEAVDSAKKAVKKSSGTPQIVSDRTAKIIVRYIVAYHFFVRGTFEEIPDNSLVAQVQHHFADLDIGMLDTDIACMLQAAADKVPLKKAVRDSLNTLFARYEEGFTIAKDWPSRDSDAGRMIHLLRAKSAGGKLDRSKIPGIIKQINDEINEEWRYKMKPELIKKLSNYFDSDEKLSIFIRYRAEPLFNTYHTPDEVKALKVLLDDGTLDNLVDQAAQWEKEYCSWDVTIGPAVKALRRLGSTSAGQDFNSLARYAKDHEKPLL